MDKGTPQKSKEAFGIFSNYTIVTICVLVILACCVLLIIPFAEKHKDEQAASRAHYAEHNQSVTSFPHRMTISGKNANISRVDLFEIYSNHGFTGFVIVTIDRRHLSDDDMYWLLKLNGLSQELDANAHYWPDGTDWDGKALRYLACRYTDSNVYFMFYTDHQRYSLNGKHFNVSVTYLPDGASISDKYRYSYYVEFTGAQYHNSIDHLPEEMRNVFTNALDDAANN